MLSDYRSVPPLCVISDSGDRLFRDRLCEVVRAKDTSAHAVLYLTPVSEPTSSQLPVRTADVPRSCATFCSSHHVAWCPHIGCHTSCWRSSCCGSSCTRSFSCQGSAAALCAPTSQQGTSHRATADYRVCFWLVLTFTRLVQDEETGHFDKDLESMHIPDVSFHLASSECSRFCPSC